MLHVSLEYLDDSLALEGRPGEERERTHYLKDDFPVLAIGQRADEYLLVWPDPIVVFPCQLLEKIDGTHRDQGILVASRARKFDHSQWIRLDHRVHLLRLRKGATITAAEQRPDRFNRADARLGE